MPNARFVEISTEGEVDRPAQLLPPSIEDADLPREQETVRRRTKMDSRIA
jgi:hypothetical protein